MNNRRSHYLAQPHALAEQTGRRVLPVRPAEDFSGLPGPDAVEPVKPAVRRLGWALILLAVSLVLLEIAIFNIKIFLPVILCLNLVWIFVFFATISGRTMQVRALAALPPITLIVSASLVMSILESMWVKQILIWLVILLGSYYLRLLRERGVGDFQSADNKLFFLTNYLVLMDVFLVATSLFIGLVFFSLPKLLLTALAGLAVALLTGQLFLTFNQAPKNFTADFGVIVLIVIETTTAVAFLPHSFYVKALIVTSVFYLASGLARHGLSEALERRVYQRYFAVSIAVIVLVLVSARWT